MPAARKTAKPSAAVKALFVGNSFTARNDLPGLIAGLASAAGERFEYELISEGGASLRRHWNAGTSADAIRSGKYDYVVLQEQSTLPIKNAQRMHENVQLFDALIRSAGSKMVLYMTWARRSATADARAKITEAYEAIGKELDATVVPVGRAWQQFLKKHDASLLYDRDGSHPTLAGSYLAACVFFRTLFGRSPAQVNWWPPELSDAEARVLQAAAARV